ncbi:MAG: hypothetical protein WCC90_20440, partial [Methylocella sp.]
VIPCQSCHNFEKGTGRPTSGPSLFGVVGRAKGSVQGFEYSEALKSEGGNWTYADLDVFLANSKAFAQDTKIAFAGESDPAKRADTIDYLHSLSENPEPLLANWTFGAAICGLGFSPQPFHAYIAYRLPTARFERDFRKIAVLLDNSVRQSKEIEAGGNPRKKPSCLRGKS